MGRALLLSRIFACLWLPRRADATVFCEPKVHLFLEGVHRGNLHLHFLAEPDQAPAPPANEMAARRIEQVEIILQTGQVHQSAHPQIGHIYEKTKVADIDHERRITAGPPGFELRLE